MKRTSQEETRFGVDLSIYPLEAIEAACHALTDRVYARLSRSDGQVEVRLSPKKAAPEAALRALEGEFHNELLHQSLRLKVSEANQKLREFIVTKALVSAQPPALLPAPPAESCPECASQPQPQGQQAPAVDEELEKEIEKLLTEIEKSDAGADPMGIVAPWEDKHGQGQAGAQDAPQGGDAGKKTP